MVADSGVEITDLRVDGGMTMNELLMQFQADILGTNVVRPKNIETTATGAALAAGISVGYWDSLDVLRQDKDSTTVWKPKMEQEQVDTLYAEWQRAVKRSLNWEYDAD